MGQQKVYDIIGIGIGPFNLGLAAILEDVPQLSALFLDQHPAFDWHPGMLLPTARMQVPYFADLVTIVNPRSHFTYHNFLYETKGFFRFVNQDNIYPLRKEYNRYCQWVAAQLETLLFGHTVEAIHYDKKNALYLVQANNRTFQAKHLVLGTGTVPYVPGCLKQLDPARCLHSKDYLHRKLELLNRRKFTIIGSGQSAAEIFNDLLPHADAFDQLSWFTRSDRFHPMDVSPFATEMTSLDYIDHFFQLGEQTKADVLKEHQYLYKGINANLLTQINESLYIHSINGTKDNIHLHANCELVNTTHNQYDELILHFRHRETKALLSNVIIAATGYHQQAPSCIEPIKKYISWTSGNEYAVNRNYSIDNSNSIFIQNAELQTHGFNSADLGMGPYRNAIILNTILGYPRFTLERNTAFQSFSMSKNYPGNAATRCLKCSMH
jgi:lysine N6-hydroxylase